MKKLLISMLALGLCAASVHAEETMGESATATGKSAKRSMKKGVNRAKEAACMEGDLKCAAKKGEHRMHEGADATKDKASEMKDKVD